MKKKKVGPSHTPCKCNVCRKCWKMNDPLSSLNGSCMYGGPYGGYITDDGRTITLEEDSGNSDES